MGKGDEALTAGVWMGYGYFFLMIYTTCLFKTGTN